jgi:hypothetical protein
MILLLRCILQDAMEIEPKMKESLKKSTWSHLKWTILPKTVKCCIHLTGKMDIRPRNNGGTEEGSI